MHRYPFGGTDAVIHIAEEMKDPERNIPIVMYDFYLSAFLATKLILDRILTLTIGFFTAFPLLLAMMLRMTNTEAVIDSPYPYAELLYQITGSRLLTTAIMCWVSMILYCRSESQNLMIHKSLIGYVAALIGQWITCGRLAWAFARDVSAFVEIIIILRPFSVHDRLNFFPCIMIPFLSTFYSHCSSVGFLTQPISRTLVNATSSHFARLYSHSASALCMVYYI